MIVCQSSSSDAFVFTEFRGKEVTFTAKVLFAVGDGWTADICKEVEALSAWIGIGVLVEGTNVLL
jgi:hypothetical protein